MKTPFPIFSTFLGWVGAINADDSTPYYSAGVRNTLASAGAGAYALGVVFAGGATDVQLFTIWHAANALKTVKVRKISINVLRVSAAAIVSFELRRLAGGAVPATGNPQIQPNPYSNFDPLTSETVVLALPTTPGGVDNNDYVIGVPFEANFATPLNDQDTLGLAGQEVVLYQYKGFGKPLEMEAGNAVGYVVSSRSSAAASLTFTGLIEFTEE
jgi:hypothetical protein